MRVREPLPRTGDRALDDVGRHVERRIDATAASAAQRWTVRDERGASGQVRPGEFLRIFRACTVAVPAPGPDAVGREARVVKSASGAWALAIEALPGCTIIGTTSTSASYGALHLVAVSATEWEARA